MNEMHGHCLIGAGLACIGAFLLGQFYEHRRLIAELKSLREKRP